MYETVLLNLRSFGRIICRLSVFPPSFQCQQSYNHSCCSPCIHWTQLIHESIKSLDEIEKHMLEKVSQYEDS